MTVIINYEYRERIIKDFMLLENQLFLHFGLMNSPLPIAIGPLSASQRGTIDLHSPFFCLQEKRAGGLSSCISKYFSLFVIDSR
jgi:hypothetical protein